jgi:putative ABC transport system permease protein
MGMFLQDLKYGLRIHAKTYGSTLIAVLTLALGIGAGTAVFSVVSAVLLKPLPYREPANIAMAWRIAPAFFGNNDFPWNPRDFRLFSQQSTAFQYAGAFKSDSFNFTGAGEPALLDGLRASAGFFPALGVSPALGRVFSPEEDQPGHERVVILSHQLWRDRFDEDAGVVGRSVDLNGYSYTIVGVMPPGFAFPHAEEMPAVLDFPREAQLWVPMGLSADPAGPDELAVIGRLKPGISMDQAQVEMNVFESRVEKSNPVEKGWSCRVTPLARQVVGDSRRALLLILGAVGVVLLIACSNVASLLLAKLLERRREFTLRAALGAARYRLIRQLLTESLLLAIAGGALGILLGEAGILFVKKFGPSNIPRLREVGLDLRVFAFVLAITFITGIFFGLLPSFAIMKEDLVQSLKEGHQRSGVSRTGSSVRNTLLVSQIALAMVLVIAGGLLVRTFYHLLSVDPGFNPARVLTFELSLPLSKYKGADRMAQVYRNVLQGLQSLPGAQSAGLTSSVPMGGPPDGSAIRIPNRTVPNEKVKPFANYSFASPGYFKAIGASLLRGRDFADSDKLDSQPVTIINSAMAKKFWPGEDPIGKQVGVQDPHWPVRTIVGVVADIRRTSLREVPDPEMYVPYSQNEIKVWPAMQTMQVALRTNEDPDSMAESVRSSIHSVDPDLPVAKVATLTTLVDNSMTQPRFSMLLIGSFGALALLLASIGMFGVISYSVTQRTQEIGVRMALGAQRWKVLMMVLGQSARLALVGIVIGLIAALGITRMMESFLYGIRATDPLTFASVSLLWAAVAFVASYFPAYRATRVDPMIALRYE